ncbi:MAG TPA: hypothetical protein VFZ58_01185 [Candidatus Saccharimonadales bacterium]
MAAGIAQLVGTLATIAFTVLGLYLVQSRMSGRITVHVGVASSLLAAFVTMLFNTIYFVIISGTMTAEAAMLTIVHVPAMAVSLILLLLAVAIVSSDIIYMTHARGLCKVMTVAVGPVMACGFFGLGVFGISKDDCTGCGYFGTNPWYMSPTLWGMGVMVVVLGLTCWFTRLPDKPAKTDQPYVTPAYIGVATIMLDFVLHLVVSLFVPADTQEDLPGNGVLIAMVIGNGLLMTFFAYVCANALRRTSPPEKVPQPYEP